MIHLCSSISGSLRSDSDKESTFESPCRFVQDSSATNINQGSAVRTQRRRRIRCATNVAVWMILASLLLVSTPLVAEARPVARAGVPRITAAPVVPVTPKTKQMQLQKQQQQQQTPTSLYLWGNFGQEPEPLPLVARMEAKLRRLLSKWIAALKLRWQRFLAEDLTPSNCLAFTLRVCRSWVFWYFSKDCLASIYEDQWHAERDPDSFFGSGGMWISKGGHKDVVRKRLQRSRRNRQWVGLGYTPRLVWLVGVLLRGTFQSTAIPKVFNPTLTGWGAGTILGAKCTHQEWISTFMIGWFGSEHYWRFLFGCNGPPYAEPGFDGIPVFITKIRNVRL